MARGLGCKIADDNIGKGSVRQNADGSESVRIVINVPAKTMKKLRRRAKLDETSISSTVRSYINRGLRKDTEAEELQEKMRQARIPDDFLDT